MGNQHSGGFLSAAGLAVFFCGLALVGAYIVIAGLWGYPDPISTIAPVIDQQSNLTMWIGGSIFFLAQIILGLLIFKFRDRGQTAEFSHGNTTLEITWTAATAVVFVGLAILGRSAWADLHFVGAAPDAIKVEVTAAQFEWQFRYAGPDNKFGTTDPALVSEATGNPLGLDYDEPAAQDDVVMPVMAIPVNREVEVTLRSKDVIHNFFVPNLRIKQDVVPGLAIPIHFTTNKTGEYEVACFELCGLGHYRMRSTMTVMSDQDFNQWLRDNAP